MPGNGTHFWPKVIQHSYQTLYQLYVKTILMEHGDAHQQPTHLIQSYSICIVLLRLGLFQKAEGDV